jgi:hypothetical protein
MSSTSTLEERVAALEAEMANMKRPLACNGDATDWVDQLSGSLKDYPEWADIVRLGSELCEREAGYGKVTGNE